MVGAESGAQARAHYGLAGAEADFPVGDGLFVLRFETHWPALFRASFGGRTTAGAAWLDSTLVLPEPFLGTGYTAYAPAAVPEYWSELTEVPGGAEIWHLAEDGSEGWAQGLARYPGRYRNVFAALRLQPGGEANLSPGGAQRRLWLRTGSAAVCSAVVSLRGRGLSSPLDLTPSYPEPAAAAHTVSATGPRCRQA